MIRAKVNADERLEPIGAALERAGVELSRIAEMISSLEDTVSRAIGDLSTPSHIHIGELQRLDEIRQKIACSAEFLYALTQRAPREWLIDALDAARSLTLAELAITLGGGERDGAEAAPVDHFELFD